MSAATSAPAVIGATPAVTAPAASDDDRAALYAGTCYTKLTLDDVKAIWSHYPSDLSSQKLTDTSKLPKTTVPPGSKLKALRRIARVCVIV
jgi:hypothetical protein